MKSARLFLLLGLCIVIINIFQTMVLAVDMESLEQFQFDIPRGEVPIQDQPATMFDKLYNIDAGGNLNLSIPLYTVPGKIPIDLTLACQSGIKMDDGASWVGLGWSFAGWSVKRITVHGDDPNCFQQGDYTNRNDLNDMYQVSVPGNSIKFLNLGSMKEPHFVPQTHSNYSLQADTSFEDAHNRVWYYYRHNYFIMTSDDGTRYVFKRPLRRVTTRPANTYHVIGITDPMDFNRNEDEPLFENSEWLLTAILSHDYHDGGGDPLNPLDCAYPSVDNGGYWVAFKYSGFNGNNYNDYTSVDTLLMGKANSNLYCDHTDSTENAYLRQIITPNNVICFELDELTRFRTLRYLRSHPDDSKKFKDGMLSTITVYRTPDYFNPGLCDEIFKVSFKYSGESGDSLLGLRHGLYGTYRYWNVMTPDGEPALRIITMGTYSDFSNGTEKIYTFDYYDNHLNQYAYIYNYIVPPYDFDKISQYFMRGSVPTTATITWESAYANSHDPYWMYNNVFKVYWGNRDYFGYFYNYPMAWSLKSMTMPYGINMEVEYEKNIFPLPNLNRDTDIILWHAGGPRVKRITFNKQPFGLTGNYNYCDYAQNYAINLQYGTDTLHCGAPTSLPASYHKFQTRANGMHSFMHRPYPSRIEIFLPDYVTHKILYSNIRHLFNTGGITDYTYYTDHHSKLTMSYSELVRVSYYIYDTLDNITVSYSTWLDHSPKMGLLKQKCMYDNADSLIYLEGYSYDITLDGCIYNRNDDDLFTERFTWYPGSIGSSQGFTTGSHVFESYNVILNGQIVEKDGVTTITEYNYDNLGRLSNSVAHSNDHDRIQHYEYLLDCDLDTTCFYCNNYGVDNYYQTICLQYDVSDTYYISPGLWRIEVDTSFNNANYLGYYSYIKSITENMAAPDSSWQSLEKYTRYNYRSNFPSQNLPGLNKIWYVSAGEQWVDSDQDKNIDSSALNPSELVRTEILDIDKYGNPTRIMYPDGRIDAYIYNYNGLEAVFANVHDNGYGILTLETTEFDDETGMIFNQPAPWNMQDYYYLIDNTFAFTGSKSLKVPGIASIISNGPSCLFGQVDSGLYIADLWVNCPEPDKFKLYLHSQGGVTASACPTFTNEWERLVCSVYVANQGDSLSTYTTYEYAAAGNTTYVDDYRIYPVGSLVRSQTFDDGLRLSSVSDYNNIPIRQYYDQFGGVMAGADYKEHPFSGSEQFFISSLPNSSDVLEPDGYYNRTKPNAVYNFTNRGLGLVEDFSNDPMKKGYSISGTGDLWWDQWKERLRFNHSDSTSCYSEFVIPVDSFSNGFMAFDIYRSTGTSMSITFGFDNGSDSGYAASFSCYGDISLFEYETADYGNATSLASFPFGTFDGAWKIYVTQDKQRLMLGIVDHNICLFWNNDCLYQTIDSSLDNYSALKIRIQSDLETDSTMWIDNLVFHNDPIVTADYINSYGLVKQSQSYDGEKIIVAGNRNDAKGRESVSFLPVEFEPNLHYTASYEPDTDHVAIFDYINSYFNDRRLYSWNPGNGLNPADSIYSYYSDTSTGVPDCRGENQTLYPYYQTTYYDDALSRVWQNKYPGIYRNYHYSFNQYKNTFDTAMAYKLPGLDTAYFRQGSVFEEINIDENANSITSFKDKLGRIIALRYDSLLLDWQNNWGHPINGDSIYMWFDLDYNGNPILTVQPEGTQIVKSFNNQSWLVYDSSGDYGVIRNVYDQLGNLRFSMNAADKAQSPSRFRYYKYDGHNRVIEEGYFAFFLWAAFFNWEYANDPEFPSDDYGNLRTITAEYEYDIGEFARGLLTKAWKFPSGDPDSASWESYDYDEYGRIIKVEQFVYGIDDSLPRVMLADYNLPGDLARLIYPGGKSVDYFYNMAGRVSHVIDSDSTLKISYEYWPDGSIKRKTLGLPENLGPAQFVDYRYNCRGWLESINNGWVDSLTVGSGDHFALKLTYDSGGYGGCGYFNGNVASYDLKVSPGTFETAIKQRFNYDLVDRLQHESYDGFQVPDSVNYVYDEIGNIQTVMLYDRTDSTLYDYIYYENSNRLEQVTNLAQGDDNFVYTPAGAMSEYGNLGMSMSYNPYQEMVTRSRVFDIGTNTVSYRYNTNGKRIAKDYRYYFQYICGDDPVDPTDPNDPPPQPLNSSSPHSIEDSSAVDFGDFSPDTLEKITTTSGSDGGEPTYCLDSGETRMGYYYFGDNLLCEYSGSGEANLKGNYVYVNGRREAQFLDEPGEVRYFLTDHLGSVVATVRPDGQLRSFCQYRPFGKIQHREINDPFISNTFGYTGHKLDEELGIDWNYLGARYYDPELRIFTQVDPQSDQYPSLSPYLYCANNPIKYIDPDGQFVETAIDVISVGLSAKDLYDDPSWANAGWLALDIVCAIAPFIPAVGVVRHAGKIDDVIKGADKVSDVAKKVPNPHGRPGGPAHQAGVKKAELKAADEFKGQTVDIRTEKKIETLGGVKDYRYGDVVALKEGKPVKVYQVGDVLKDGRTPPKRERSALRDIENQGISTEYLPKE